MTITPLSLSDILTSPTITPGLGGWDGQIMQHMSDMRAGRMNMGLLARLPETILSGTGTTLITVPTGYICVPWLVLIVPENTTSWVGREIEFSIESAGSHWAGPIAAGTRIRLDDLGATGKRCLVVGPRPDADLAFGEQYPQSFPFLSGDDATIQTFRATADTTLPPATYSVYGMCWPTTDS